MSTPTKNPELAKVLGRWDTLAVSFGAMIGFGWILLTGGFIENAGVLGATLAVLAGGAIMLLVAALYAELVVAMPHVGGGHHYVLRAMGSRAAFFTSWTLVLGYVSVVAFEAVALPQTLLYLFPDMLVGKMWTVAGYDVFASWAAVGIVAAIGITWLNLRGVRQAAIFQSAAVAFLLGVGAVLIFGSGLSGSVETMQPLFTGGFAGFVAVLVAIPFLFVGFDVVPQSASEINLPGRKIGIMLLISVVMAIFWYGMVIVTTGSVLPIGELAGSSLPVADAMTAMWNSPLMGQILVIGGIAGILTSWNGFLIGASRLVYAMAQSGMLPIWFGKLHPKYRTPSNAILAIGALSVIAPLFGRKMLVWLVDAGSLSIALAFFAVSVAFVVLRRREPNMERPFKLPVGIAFGTVTAILTLALVTFYLPGMPAALVPAEWIIFGLWWVAGLAMLVRLPAVKGGPDADERMLVATGLKPAEAAKDERELATV